MALSSILSLVVVFVFVFVFVCAFVIVTVIADVIFFPLMHNVLGLTWFCDDLKPQIGNVEVMTLRTDIISSCRPKGSSEIQIHRYKLLQYNLYTAVVLSLSYIQNPFFVLYTKSTLYRPTCGCAEGNPTIKSFNLVMFVKTAILAQEIARGQSLSAISRAVGWSII